MKLKAWSETERKKLEQLQKQLTDLHSARDADICRETVYYESGGVRLGIDVYRPTADKYPGVRPGILFFFGGGFRVGTRLSFRDQAEACARQGYVAFSAEYRISLRYDVNAGDSMRDGAAAWMFLRENAGKWHLDPGRIVLSGGSAGGMVAAMCGPISGKDPAGLALFNPVILDDEDPKSQVSRLVSKEIGGVAVFNTKSVQPGIPVLVMHGEEDQVVPISSIRRYAEYANAHSGNVKLVAYPRARHSFYFSNLNRAFFYLTMGELLQFLEKISG